MHNNGIRVGSYARISFDWEGKALGVERQRQDTERLADLRGWTIAEHYVDNNLSAYKRDLVRPEFERLLSDLETGHIDGIVVYDLDRLTRQPEQLERVVRIYERRQDLVFATVQNDINLGSSDGLTMARVMISFASKASMDTSRRQKRKNQERAERGLPHGSRRPYGYEADLVTIRESESAVLRDVAAKLIAGWSFKECTWWLNEQGHTTTTGKQFYPITLRNMLSKPRYAGQRVHQGKTYDAIWQAVFTPDEWQRLQSVMSLRTSPVGGAPKYLLTGLLYCGQCGSRLNGSLKSDRAGAPKRRGYYCRVQGDAERQHGCGGVRRNADALDDCVREQVFYRLDTPALGDLLKPGEDADTVALMKQRDWQRTKIDSLVDDYATGLLTRAQLARAKATAEAELTRIERRIAAQTARTRPAGLLSAGHSVREAWEKSGSDEWRRNLLGLLIKRITVLPETPSPSICYMTALVHALIRR